MVKFATVFWGIYAGLRAANHLATSPVTAKMQSTQSMKLLTEFRLYASYYQFYVHDSKVDTALDDFGEPGDFLHMIGSHRQGYITNDEVVCFGTDAHLNVHWMQVYLANDPPDFDQAERVIALPLQLNSGKAVISGLFSEPDSKRHCLSTCFQSWF